MNLTKKERKPALCKKSVRYTQDELRETIEVMLAYTADELLETYKNGQASIYERIIAAALMLAVKEAKFYTVETLLARVCGKPKETIDITPAKQPRVKFTAVDAADAATAYAELVRR